MIPAYTRHQQTNTISTPIIRHTNIHNEPKYIPINNHYSEKKPTEIQHTKKCAETNQEVKSKKPHYYLSAEKISEMLIKFFTETHIPKETIAETLGVTVKKLNCICFRKATPALIRKINLPLIHLYCKTRFNS